MSDRILLAVEVAANAATIYRTITTTEGESAFWTDDCEVQPIEGSIARFGFPGAPVDARMRIDTLEPGGSLVRWHCQGDLPGWAGTTVEWMLLPGEMGGTMVAFRHSDWADDYPELEVAKIAWVWAMVLGRLKGYCETGTPQPFFVKVGAPA